MKTTPDASGHASTLPSGLSAYNNDGCRCADCREGNRVYQQSRRDALYLRVPPVHNNSAYTNYGCRCDTCRAAHREARVKSS